MRKIIGVLAGIISCMFLSLSVKADVIWEPDDSFYWRHTEECTSVNRSFTANGPDNKVIAYKSPELPQEVETWENGHRVRIYFTYEDQDGILWGLYDDFQGTTGWVPMDYMELVYDSISFEEDHEAEIIGDVGSLDEKDIGEEIRFWNYPGSEEYTSIKADEDYMPEYRGIYVDGNGTRWGHVWYYFGMKDTWVCIDQPSADFEQIFPEGVPEVDRKPSDQSGAAVAPEVGEEEGRITPKLNRNMVLLIIALVIVVVVLTGILLKRLKGGKEAISAGQS